MEMARYADTKIRQGKGAPRSSPKSGASLWRSPRSPLSFCLPQQQPLQWQLQLQLMFKLMLQLHFALERTRAPAQTRIRTHMTFFYLLNLNPFPFPLPLLLLPFLSLRLSLLLACFSLLLPQMLARLALLERSQRGSGVTGSSC